MARVRDSKVFSCRAGVCGSLVALSLFCTLFSLWSLYALYYDGEAAESSWSRTRGGRPNDIPAERSFTLPSKYGPPINALEELHYALETMQDEYFQVWVGKWPTCIDWTGAVVGTFVSASLYSLTRSLDYILPPTSQQSAWTTIEGEKVENEINRYFSQSIAYYFGEDAFSIRLQAYDDMLWVVLGWLEGVRFIKLHTDAHYPTVDLGGSSLWYGTQFVPGFAHRANVFYDIASQGWDTKLCGGGMTWNPRLTPYKNAITNQLYISASIGMYLYFPGDRNPSPYVTSREHDALMDASSSINLRTRPHDPVYLKNAIDAYDWLKSSNMTNEKGLYVDGFHIAGWNRNGSIGTGNCDVRNEMVYTYNQGVVLSGLRGLWESTGKLSYLQDGHQLVRSVIAATGWQSPTERRKWWSGLGRNGILEEACDWSGTCSQNGQTFKGIFFHHLTLFCEPLPRTPLVPGKTHIANPVEYNLHAQSCREYAAWVVWNARGAMATRDRHGRFGMWWGASLWNSTDEGDMPHGAEDYRNHGLGSEKRWGSDWHEGLGILPPLQTSSPDQKVTMDELTEVHKVITHHSDLKKRHETPIDRDFTSNSAEEDLNDRGRGRTVETQGGGVAVLRAMWEFVHMYSDQ